MPAKRTTAKAKAAAATARTDRALKGGEASRSKLDALLAAWVDVAETAVSEIKSETSVTIVNTGDQVQKHPAVTVLEAASKRIEALVVLVEQFEDGSPEGVVGGPPPAWTPKVVDGD